MKHKKLLIVALVVVVMAIGAAVAYAWWSDTVSAPGNSVTTGHVQMETSGLPIVADGLVPQTAPADEAPDSDYPAVQYFWVKNSSTIPLMFYGWLSDGNDPKDIRPYVNARIWLLGSSTSTPVSWWTGLDPTWVDTFQPAAGGPFLSYEGPLSKLWSGESAGINYLSSRYWTGTSWVRTPIGPGEYGVYRIAVWLDSSAPDSTQDATVGFTVNFTGMQDEAWTAAGYDTVDFVP